MNTEVYIENNRLDISADISALLTFAIDDIKDFSARSTTWSKTIVLPGTANNNKLFGHIFQIGQANTYSYSEDNVGYNFNASQSAECIIFQDQMQTFKGVLRLLEIIETNGRIEYEVAVFGKMFSLSVALSGALLEDLDFSAYDHVYNGAAISNSWENVSGVGYFYPLIDYGTYSTNKHDWDIRTFRPALYVREYIDKMITVAGFRWQSDLFDTDRFKKLVIPHNQKQLTILTSLLSSAEITGPKNYVFPPAGGVLIDFDTETGTGFTANPAKTIYTYNGTITTNVQLTFTFQGTFTGFSFFPSTTLNVWKNGEGSTNVYNASSIFSPFTFTATINISVSPGDTLEFRFSGDSGASLTLNTATFEITTASNTPVPISYGDTVQINETIPKNVRQVDFLVSIVKLFNLYVYEDQYDKNLIHFTTYIDYYPAGTQGAIDWTYKMDRNKPKRIKPMSELSAKIYDFKFKEDNDYFNELYRKRYGQGYGDYTFDSQYEFADQKKSFEIIFSSTPLVGYGGEDKVYPTIFKQTGNAPTAIEENVDSNIRILQTKKIVGVTSWDMKDGAATVGFFTKYGYAGHLDDPDAPDNDLNFGALRELFFILATGNLSNTQFNVYWSGYMAEVTNKDSKLLIAKFYLTPKDILLLDFSKYIYIDGVAFRLNAIRDYNASKPATCTAELIKLNSATYSEATDNDGPPDGNFLLWDNAQTLDWDDADELLWQGDTVITTVNWSHTVTSGVGTTKIYVNAVLVVNATVSGQSGSFTVNDGDTIQSTVVGSPTSTKGLIVDSDVDGNLFTGSGPAPQTYSYAAIDGRTYTIQGSVT